VSAGPPPPADGAAFPFAGRSVHVVDLSQRLSNATSAFEPMPHEIEYFDHTDTIAVAEAKFGVGAEHWLEGRVWAHERVTLTTHSGTHVDAPYHYHPTSAGRPARTIAEVPLRWLMGDGVLLDLRHCDRVEGIREAHVRAELERIGHEPRAFDIVLVRTGTDARSATSARCRRRPASRCSRCRSASSARARHGRACRARAGGSSGITDTVFTNR